MEQYYDKLMECVLEGEEEEAVEITRAEIENGTDPLDIVQKCLVPILDDVGDKFSKLEIFLPDLIMSADVAKAVKDEIRAHLLSSSNDSESAGKWPSALSRATSTTLARISSLPSLKSMATR